MNKKDATVRGCKDSAGLGFRFDTKRIGS
jgi:hypothetical protein